MIDHEESETEPSGEESTKMARNVSGRDTNDLGIDTDWLFDVDGMASTPLS